MQKCFVIFIVLVACGYSSWGHALPPLKVAFSDNKAPYSSNCKCGVEYELVNYLVEKMGYSLEPVFVPNKRMTLLLQSGSVDAIVDVLRESPRTGGFTSLPYIQYHNVAISLKSRRLRLQSQEDLKPFKVVAFQNATGNLGAKFKSLVPSLSGYEEVSPQAIENHQLYGQRADVVISDLYIFLAANTANSQRTEPLPAIEIHPIFPVTEYSLEFKDRQLRDLFDYQLTHMNLAPVYRALHKKYLQPLSQQSGFSPEPEWLRLPTQPRKNTRP